MNKGISTPIGIIIIVLVALMAGGIIFWQYFGLEKKEIKAPEEKIIDETADWQTYRNEEYGFEIKYPPELTFSSKGPNVAQQSLDNGEQISGTVQPSYDTLIFSDQQNKEQFKIEIFHPYEKAISIDNYKDGYLYLYGPCDLRWGFVPTTTQMINKNSIDILKVKGSHK